MFPQNFYHETQELLHTCSEKDLKIAVAESCTGGLIGGLITAIPGSSDVFDRGFIAYTNQAKGELLGVPAHIFMVQGAVSKECACAMAEGAIERSKASLGISATGIAGPSGATADKAVGLVHIACARTGFATLHEQYNFKGDREHVREQAVAHAIKLMNKLANL